jgi:hypothetical protein
VPSWAICPPFADRARSAGHLHPAEERVLSTRVEDHQAQPLGGLQRHQDAIERNGFILDVDLGPESRVDGDHVVHVADLNAVTREVHNRNIGILCGIEEVAQRALEVLESEILPHRHRTEPDILEHPRDGGGVVDRIGKLAGVLVRRVADDEGDPFLPRSRLGGTHEQEECCDCGNHSQNHCRHPCRPAPGLNPRRVATADTGIQQARFAGPRHDAPRLPRWIGGI